MWKAFNVARVALALALQGVPTAYAAVVGLNPSVEVVDVGDLFSVTISGSSFASNVDGGALSLTFDPTVVEVQDVIIDPAWNFVADTGLIDNAAGTVSDIQFMQFGNTVMGDFAIAEVQLQAKGPGESVVALLPANSPFGSGGNPIPVEFAAGLMQVQPVPEPAAGWLMVAGIALIFVRRLRALAH